MKNDFGLKWTTPKRVETSNGLRDLSSATPNPEFWELWRREKYRLQLEGYTVKYKRREGVWVVQRWIKPVMTEAEKEAARRMRNPVFEPRAGDVLAPRSPDRPRRQVVSVEDGMVVYRSLHPVEDREVSCQLTTWQRWGQRHHARVIKRGPETTAG